MAKKILCVIVVMIALVCVLASCEHEHNFGGRWETVKESTCIEQGTVKMFCSECDEYKIANLILAPHQFGEEQIIRPDCTIEGKRVKICKICGYEHSEGISPQSKHYFDFTITKKATCTTEGERIGKCKYCDQTKTEVIPASHIYSDGICTVCNRTLINIIFPTTPITVHDFNYNGSIDETCKITDIHITSIDQNYNGTYTIKFSWAGEKTYDDDGNNYSSSVGFAYKIYDSEGYVVKSGSTYSVDICVGEKFKDQKFEWSYADLDPSETYTLEILNFD